ncbi:MAG: bifunctional (p)ppGpp synthetase/guanosine-3',5'-bis(diphosphate) 3'-pyrophosphohydrolase, partial [Myxococcales bacterium]|nr:bifunctional (p)ppGpp synthetase/guanosine-3',5'-bis(diphosphate) 3'-pyrophosphohydrolase [Myxococcales bacterium]
ALEVDDGALELEEIGARYGEDVRELVDGVRRLGRMRWDKLDASQAESMRKMFLAMAADVRVVIVALALRVRDMRALGERSTEERRRQARETLEIFAPLANRLGIFLLKWELEDLSLRELEPEIYRDLGKQLAQKRIERTAFIDEVIGVLRARLAEAGITGVSISGRPKHIYSIYKKMQRKQVGFDEIYDVSAVRVIVDRVEQCYAALGVVHSLWTPIPGEFDDYIARPKGNGYQSLHTAVAGPGGRGVEVQIRTHEMHYLGEYGVAAHWRYKEGNKSSRLADEKFNFLRQLMDWQKDVSDPRELVDSLKTDIFQDQVYVFTPQGDVVDLPRGATPVDFAYRIHTSVGHRCRGALVNGQIVPLDHKLKTADRVEILTHKRAQPRRDWLNPQLGYVHSPSARQKIRHWFRQQGRDDAITQGRELLDRELKRAGVERPRYEEIAAQLGHERVDDLLAAVGFGNMTSQTVATKYLDAEAAKRPAPPPEPPPPPRAPERPRKTKGVSVGGVDDILSRPARCCTPVPGDKVVGYITRGKGIILHRQDCPNIISHPEPERLVDVEWGREGRETYPVTFLIEALDRPGAMRDITTVAADMSVNMSSLRFTDRKDGTAVIELVLEVRSNDQVVRLLNKFERVPAVVRARRRAG